MISGWTGFAAFRGIHGITAWVLKWPETGLRVSLRTYVAGFEIEELHASRDPATLDGRLHSGRGFLPAPHVSLARTNQRQAPAPAGSGTGFADAGPCVGAPVIAEKKLTTRVPPGPLHSRQLLYKTVLIGSHYLRRA